MTANFVRGPNTPTESAILSKVDTALDRALETLNLPLQKQAHVKRQKYTYFVVRRFTDEQDPPVTYSWFKWGVSCKAGPSSSPTPQPLLTPEAKARSLLDISIKEIEQFLINEVEFLSLSEWWEADHLDFLEQFYTHYGPDRYRSLYLANIELIRIISSVTEAAQYGRNPARTDTVEDVANFANRINRQLLSIDHLSQYSSYASNFTQLLETIVSSLVEIDEGDIEQGHVTVLSEMLAFYRDHVWMIIAHSISEYTAVGPNAELIRSDSRRAREELIAEFTEAFQMNRRRCQAMELLSTEGEHSELEQLGQQSENTDISNVTQTQRSDLSQGLDKRQNEAIAAFEEVDLSEK